MKPKSRVVEPALFVWVVDSPIRESIHVIAEGKAPGKELGFMDRHQDGDGDWYWMYEVNGHRSPACNRDHARKKLEAIAKELLKNAD